MTKWRDLLRKNAHGGDKDREQQQQQLLLPLPPDDSNRVVLKKLFSKFTTQRIHRFLRPNVNNEAEPFQGGLLTRMTPDMLSYLHSRRDGTSSTISESTAAVPDPGLFSKIKRKIKLLSGSTSTSANDQQEFHGSEKKLLVKAGLPTPPLGRWLMFDSSSLAQLKTLANKRDDCTKEVEAMDAESFVSLGKSSGYMLGHLAVLVFTDAKIWSCEHLKYLGLLLFCAIAFEAIYGLITVFRIGNAYWRYVRVREEVVELNQLMEEQLRNMEIDDMEDHFTQLAANKAGFQRMLSSCNRIRNPLKFSWTFLYQILTILLTVSVIGITVNKGYIGWKSVC